MTQNQRIVQHMQKWGGITTLEAINCYGITRLPARIGELREQGIPITDAWETGENRYGELVRYKRYRLEA